MAMDEPPKATAATRDVISWPLLLALAGVVLGTASLMARNTLYTEGEVIEALYKMLIAVVASMLLLGFFKRNLAAWLVLICGGALILSQANQTRRWGMLHEEVIGVLAHLSREKGESGAYPEGLEGYSFRHPEFRDHIIYSQQDGKFHISYYLDSPGMSYWYREDSGFGFYPD